MWRVRTAGARTLQRLCVELPVGRRLGAELDVRDIRIAVNLGLVPRFPRFCVHPPGGLLLTAFDECLFALAFRGRWSCVSCHPGPLAYPIRWLSATRA